VNGSGKIPRFRNTAFPFASFAKCQLPERKDKNIKEEQNEDGVSRGKKRGRGKEATLNPRNLGDK
jgi:hypothetical protein